MTLSIQPELGKHLEQNYTLEKEIGRGGMGVVYLAHDKRLERPVAIKILQMAGQNGTQLSEEVVARFQREAKVVARMSHPNLVTVYDVGQVDDYYYMIQEYAEGHPLSDLVDNHRQLPPALVTSIGQQICLALSVAHEQGIIHRDIKPANISLSSKGVAKLMDFGIAQLNQQESGKLTQAGTMMGSFLYASPEQLQDASTVDVRTDLYSLGITLYELLTGRSPYESEQLSQIILEIMNPLTQPTSVRSLNPNVPEALEQIVTKALAKDCAQRYQTAAEMAQELGLLLQGQVTQSQTFQITFAEGGETSRSRLGEATQMRKTRVDQTLITQLRQLSHWLAQVVGQWQTETIPQPKLKEVIAKVMEPDLFGKAFSGCLIVDGRYYLLICGGQYVGAADLQEHQLGEAVFEALPAEANSLELRLAPAGEDLAPLLLANILLEQGEISQSKLDSSLMDLVPLIETFASQDEPFSGYVVCYSSDNVFYYGYEQGQPIFSAQARESQLDRDTWLSLSQLALKESVIMNVYWPQPVVLGPSAQKLLAGSSLKLDYTDPNKATLQTLCELGDEELPIHLIRESKDNLELKLETEGRPELKLTHHSFPLLKQLEASVSRRFADWLVHEYFYLLNSSGNTTSLKYIYSWIPSIQVFRFDESLPGEDGSQHRFTLGIHGVIPSEGYDKLLLLVRVGKGTPEAVSTFMDEVIQVKKHLIKSGDIGGAMYVSEGPFETEALKLFYARTVEPRKKGFGLASLDKLTKYKGFVRIGMNRGFHLNLIEYQADKQQFEVIAPLLK